MSLGSMSNYSFRFTNKSDAEEFRDYVTEEELWIGRSTHDNEVVVVSIYDCTAEQLYDWIENHGLKMAE